MNYDKSGLQEKEDDLISKYSQDEAGDSALSQRSAETKELPPNQHIVSIDKQKDKILKPLFFSKDQAQNLQNLLASQTNHSYDFFAPTQLPNTQKIAS